MFVRVFDKSNNKYYKSMVYALINSGYDEQAILFNPYKEAFELIDYLDKESKKYVPLYECINSNKNEWVSYEKVFLLKLKKYLKENNCTEEIMCFRGYKEVFDNYKFMLKILQTKQVPIESTTINLKNNEDTNEWNYIRTQEDANEFMKLFVGFHDSTLDKLTYEEAYGKTQLNVVFDNSGWYGVVELCFEGLSALNLRTLSENGLRYIYILQH